MKDMKRIKYILPALALIVVFMSACSTGNVEEGVPVAGDEAQETETTAEADGDMTTDDSIQGTSDSGSNDITQESSTVEDVTEQTTEQVTTPNYIYESLTDDMGKIQTAGDVEMSEEERAELTELLAACEYRISFKAVSIDGSKCISYNSEEEYFAASAIKAPYLLYCYKQIDAGNGTLDEEMIYTSKYYREGTGTIKDSEEGTVYPLSEIMRRAIWNSDNSGYYMCTERWGKDGYNQLMEEIGADRLKFSTYSIWASDVGVNDFIIAWKSIYDYFQTDTEGAKTFYESATNCKWNLFGGGIKDCVIAQKYGWADDAFSNAGIVYGENETYLLAVFTDAAGEQEQIRQYTNIVNRIHYIMDR